MDTEENTGIYVAFIAVLAVSLSWNRVQTAILRLKVVPLYVTVKQVSSSFLRYTVAGITVFTFLVQWWNDVIWYLVAIYIYIYQPEIIELYCIFDSKHITYSYLPFFHRWIILTKMWNIVQCYHRLIYKQYVLFWQTLFLLEWMTIGY